MTNKMQNKEKKDIANLLKKGKVVRTFSNGDFLVRGSDHALASDHFYTKDKKYLGSYCGVHFEEKEPGLYDLSSAVSGGYYSDALDTRCKSPLRCRSYHDHPSHDFKAEKYLNGNWETFAQFSVDVKYSDRKRGWAQNPPLAMDVLTGKATVARRSSKRFLEEKLKNE